MELQERKISSHSTPGSEGDDDDGRLVERLILELPRMDKVLRVKKLLMVQGKRSRPSDTVC